MCCKVELEAEEELMVNVFKERFRAQMESRMRLEELSKVKPQPHSARLML